MHYVPKIITATVAAAALAAGIGACGSTAGNPAYYHPIKAAEQTLRTEFEKIAQEHQLKPLFGNREAVHPPCRPLSSAELVN